ncbi:MAG: matrixin family metalloprotease [Pseudomonadota bacterium]
MLLAQLVGCTGVLINPDDESVSGAYDAPNFAHDVNNTAENASVAEDEISILPIPLAEISYYLEEVPQELNDEVFAAEVKEALNQWEWATDGRRIFYQVASSSGADLVIGFRAAKHEEGCDKGFSSMSTIAHVFTYDNGCMAGIMHLNRDLTWTMNGSSRSGTIDVRTAVMHELGHVLGLAHVNEPGHIMYPYYQGVFRGLSELDSSDIQEVLDNM